MSKISKEFWVSDEFIEQMNKPVCEFPRLARSSFEYPIEKLNTGDKHSAHKITITYEIDREVTIKESDIDKLCDGVAFSSEDISIIKKKLFGGGENE